jgi:hypothetical protein
VNVDAGVVEALLDVDVAEDVEEVEVEGEVDADVAADAEEEDVELVLAAAV